MRLVRDGLGKLGRRPATWVTFGLLGTVMTFIFVVFGASADYMADQPVGTTIRQTLTFPAAYDAVLSIAVGLGVVLAVIYGAAVAGSEWAWGTLKNAVARGESRALYAAATFGALAVVLAVALGASFAIGAVSALVGASLAGIPTGGATDAAALLALPQKLARGWLALAMAAAVGFAIASFTRSQLAGIGAGIAAYFGEQFGTGFFPEIVRFMPFSAAEAAAAISPPGLEPGVGGVPEAVSLPPDAALVVVTAWLLAGVAAGALATERADIAG